MNDKNTQNICGFVLPNTAQLSVLQAVEVLQCSVQHVYNLIAAGDLAANRIAKAGKTERRLVPGESIAGFIRRRTTGADGVDFSASENVHGLRLPAGALLAAWQVADFLNCSVQHIHDLIDAEELAATNIAVFTSAHKRPLIHRAALIHFINERAEGAY